MLFLTAESYPTFRPDVTVLFGRYLPQHGVSCDLIAPHATGMCEDAVWPAGKAITRRIKGGAISYRVLSLWHGLVCTLRANPAHYWAIQVRDMPVLATLVLPMARWKRLQFYYWMSYPIPEGQMALARARGLSAGWMKFLYPWISGWVGRRLLQHWVIPRADHIFVQSPRMKAGLVDAGVDACRLTPVLMGVDLQAMNAISRPPPQRGEFAASRAIGYLGTLDQSRHIEILFEMLALVRREIPNAILLLVGDTGDEIHRKWLQEHARRFNVADAVIWKGWLPNLRAWDIMRTAEVAVSPCPRGEILDVASPTKVPEYLALGLPVVCNDNPDQANVMQASGAGLCVPYTAIDFAEAVLRIMALEPSARDLMVRSGMEYVKTHRDYPIIAAELADTYMRLGRQRPSMVREQ